MILIANDVVSMYGKEDEEQYVKTDEFKEISKALDILAKHCKSVVVSAYTDNEQHLAYNHSGSELKDTHLGKLVMKKEESQSEALRIIRGSELSAHLSTLLNQSEEEYGISPNAVMETVSSARTVNDKFAGLSEKEKEELMSKLKSAKSMKEAEDALLDLVPEIKDQHEEVDEDRGRIRGKNKPNIEDIEKAMGLKLEKVDGYDLSDSDSLMPISDAISEGLDSSVAIVTFGISGEESNQSDVIIQFQKSLVKKVKKLSAKSGVLKLDYRSSKELKRAVAVLMLSRFAMTISENFGLPIEAISEMLKSMAAEQ